MDIAICHRLADLPAAAWNALGDGDNPFIRHEFLCALEEHHCLGQEHGWLPHHILCRDDTGRLVGALPLYMKDNSYGEFVFDWGWADAYHRNGLSYYPKLVSSIPYTPAQGPRLLTHPEADRDRVAGLLIEAALALAEALNCSSLHALFTLADDTRRLQEQGLLLRMGVQYHWHNRGYTDFDDYLSRFASKKRKNVRQERRKVKDSGIEVEVRHGDELEAHHWDKVYHYYQTTFHKKSGHPSLSLGFFQAIAAALPRQLVVFLARHQGKYVAASICYRGKTTLYGRHWGCDEHFDSLHFEVCYYQGLDYAIREGLQHFEPGAQGEHKVSRGFEPTRTWSAHWIAHPQFRTAIADHLQREQRAVEEYIATLNEHLPFRAEPT